MSFACHYAFVCSNSEKSLLSQEKKTLTVFTDKRLGGVARVRPPLPSVKFAHSRTGDRCVYEYRLADVFPICKLSGAVY